MSDLDKHLAAIDDLLAGKTRPIFDEDNPQARLPDADPRSVIQYKPPPGTYDGKMAREISGSGDNMPNAAMPAQAPLAVLGGRGMPVMMDRSPPELAMSRYPRIGTPPDKAEDGSSPSVRGSDDGSTQGSWGTGDLPTASMMPSQWSAADAEQNISKGVDYLQLLKGMFQGAL